MKMLVYILRLVCLPVAIIPFIHNVFMFRKYCRILRNAINNNNELYDMLVLHNFSTDYIGRLYSPQVITKNFRDFTEDELYDITMRALLPLTKLFERTVLIDVVGIIVKKQSDDIFIITITPYNYPRLITSLKWLCASIIINMIALVVLYNINIF